ncbi:sensor histidine kinase [Stigmatella erecta]|uniref:histidine kinase n=1 Tax=Stigmatella erecta TaxID=83460 RepID=A0A1H9ZRL3_9BACT|nr:ATP-binding protein [Stigmatella erecta]SES84398.1 His Kinase A (phospho-acceptor) domain-containing protein [Stigmatella erecta]
MKHELLAVGRAAQLTDSAQARHAVHRVAGWGAGAINVALICAFWGQWRVVSLFVCMGLGITLFNLLFLEWLADRFSSHVVEALRMGVNGTGLCVLGVVTQWHVLLWAFVPFNMFWAFGVGPWVRLRMALYLGAVNTVALLTGARPSMALAFSLIGVIGYLVSERRVEMLREAMVQLETAHQEMRRMHERALKQEHLSSLGLLAAGVAHEINNPMSFVTSNVGSMLRDLREEKALSEVMREYVDDVLPGTLDGIQRVNAIVADLRRFSGGGVDRHTDYDFNAEVEMGLRIAQVQLGHVQVEKELGEVGRVVGHPRQLVQVLVNLMVNAGQATAPGGRVRISTRREGEQILVVVRDTGAGMSEETKRRLFEPFFTTKAPGVGMGLGLSVAYGIVRAHGGHIEVESELGKGTVFTLALPRVAPAASP